MKRIAIFCDGTWNSADQANAGTPCPTNVVKLALRVAPRGDDGLPQAVHYGQGVGTGNGVDRLTGGAFGDGLTDNLFAAYRFVMHNYEPGDALYLFGFSRGAFTARSVAGMIRKVGILRRDAASEYQRALAIYRDDDHPDAPGPSEFRRKYGVTGETPVPIEFIGVWDTVGALGIPVRGLRALTAGKHKFHDVALSGTVKRACQALAIDERRGPFEAARWAYVPKPGQHISQVWFAGVHSDIGGGYARGDDPPDGWGLSDIALEWMRDEARVAGLSIDDRSRAAFTVDPQPLARMHDSKTGLYRLTPGIDRVIGMAALPTEQPDETTEQPDPTQSIHPSVLQRWDAMPSYRPRNLRDWFKRSGDPRGA